jgi:hypothetical protein
MSCTASSIQKQPPQPGATSGGVVYEMTTSRSIPI